MRYFKDIMHFGNMYGAGTNKKSQSLYSLTGYADSNYISDVEDRKSVISHYFFINGDGIARNHKPYPPLLPKPSILHWDTPPKKAYGSANSSTS